MKYKDFRRIMEEYEFQIEYAKDDFIIMCEAVTVNDIFCIRGCRKINLVKGKTLWFDRTSIDLKDVTDIRISKVMSIL